MPVNGFSAYLHNMDYKSRMYSDVRNTNNQDLKRSGQNQIKETVNANEKIKKAEEVTEKIKEPQKPLSVYGLGQLMDYKI